MQPLREQAIVPFNPAEEFVEPPALASSGSTVKVSAVIITYNEAKNIRRTLSRLHWCDEIIIVDSYSTDHTLTICREFNCNIYLKSFEGYGVQKQYAVSKAKNDWILSIDADEMLSEGLIIEILSELARNPGYTGYRLPMSLVFFNQEFLYGKESWRYFLRLFNKNYGDFTDCAFHEKIQLQGPVCKLRHRILHFSYHSFQQWEGKCSRYSTLAARKAVSKGVNWPLALVILSLPYNFLKYYLLELNFLNGVNGFYWSVLNTFYHFIKYIKIRELHAAEKDKQIINTLTARL